MKIRVFILLLAFFCSIYPATVFAAQDCSTAADIGNTYCTCDDGAVPTELAGSSFDSESCNSACWDEGATSWDLVECSDPDPTDPLLTPVNQANVSDPTLETTVTSDFTSVEKEQADFIVPILNIQIPGFAGFSKPTVTPDGTTVSINFLAEYINALYTWVLGAGALVAVVMMMIGGLQYVLARGKPKYIEKAKTRITNAITGMVLLLAAYNIAFLINPDLTRLDPIGITNVQGLEYFPPDGEDINVTPNTALDGSVVQITGDYISAYSGATLDAETLTAFQAAAEAFHRATGKTVVVASASRDLGKQASLFYTNCIFNGGTCSPSTCNPSSGVFTKSGSKYSLADEYSSLTNGSAIVSKMVQHAAYGNCPHTSGIAVDAWCNDGGSNYRHDPWCQGQLISAMISAGFCRLSSEAWHFELETKKVSKACLRSNLSIAYKKRDGSTISPTSNCSKWDFKNHYCATEKK